MKPENFQKTYGEFMIETESRAKEGRLISNVEELLLIIK